MVQTVTGCCGEMASKQPAILAVPEEAAGIVAEETIEHGDEWGESTKSGR